MVWPVLAGAGAWLARSVIPKASSLVAPLATKVSTLVQPVAARISSLVAGGTKVLSGIRDRTIGALQTHAPGLVTYAVPGYLVGKSSDTVETLVEDVEETVDDAATSFGESIGKALGFGVVAAVALLIYSGRKKGITL